MEMGEKTYLGDGVYAEYDGYHLILTANKPTTDTVYLDTQVRNALRHLLYNIASGETECTE